MSILVAEAAHFQHHLAQTTSEFVAAICATQWFEMVGMIRDRHMQKSYHVKTFEHFEMFHCIEGKPRGKPFDWIMPKATLGPGDGYKSMSKVMAVIRRTPSEDEEPYLIRQFSPCTTKPMQATEWVEKKMSNYQMGGVIWL